MFSAFYLLLNIGFEPFIGKNIRNTSKDQTEWSLLCVFTLSETPTSLCGGWVWSYTCYSLDKQGGSIINTQRTVEMFSPHVLQNTARLPKWYRLFWIYEMDLGPNKFTCWLVCLWYNVGSYDTFPFNMTLFLAWGQTSGRALYTFNILARLHSRPIISWTFMTYN